MNSSQVGVVSGAVLAPDRFTNSNSAYFFDGSAQIAVPVPSVSPVSPLTISGWFKVGTIDHWYLAVWVRNTATASQDDLYVNGNHPSYVSAGTVGHLYQATGILSTKSYADGLWHQAVVRYDPSAQRRELYVDGALLGQSSATNPPPAAIQSLTLGNANIDGMAGNEGFVGWIDDVRIYDRSLSPQRIASLYWIESQQYPPVNLLTVEVATVRVNMFLEVGTTYQLESSANLVTWTAVGAPFLATNSVSSVEFDVAETGRFFRLQIQPGGPADTDQFVWIAPGTFVMGSPSDELDRSANEGPLTQVTLTKGFWISKHEVTQGEYVSVIGTNPSWYANNTNRPVEYVRWSDATNYCATLTAQERVADRLPEGFAYRLPTEAEWEYAARAGSQTRFCYGDDLTYTNLGQYAWLPWVDAGADTDGPVATKQPNAWGLYDMHGNVWEWCQDYYSDPLPGGSIVDPQGPPTGTERVFRGGSFGTVFAAYRSASRWKDIPTHSDRGIGFRVVLAPTN